MNISISKPGKFKEAMIARDPETIGCVVILTFTVNDQDVIIKSVAGCVVIPIDHQVNIVECMPERRVPGVLNVAIALANSSVKGFPSNNASIEIDKPCCLIVPPCRTGTASYVQRGLAFLTGRIFWPARRWSSYALHGAPRKPNLYIASPPKLAKE